MTASVYDFAEIAKEARLRALEGFNQNEVKPVEMPSDSNTDPEGVGMYTAWYGMPAAEFEAGPSFTAPEQDGA